jgi:uncharacterized metal-binding protein
VKDTVLSQAVDVIDNVACSLEEIVPALEKGILEPGFGLSSQTVSAGAGMPARSPSQDSGHLLDEGSEANSADARYGDLEAIDCLDCRERICLNGQSCLALPTAVDPAQQAEICRMIETACDIEQEYERQLCRVSEVVYFCLEMDFRRIGVAFCIDLLEPAKILAGILRRFFEVVPICCKLGGIRPQELSGKVLNDAMENPSGPVLCNPLAQAEIMNRRQTDINLIVGLCIGVDSVFTRASRAPVTTLFVKDRSLANNPIGALYSEYYLRESLAPLPGKDLAMERAVRALHMDDGGITTPRRRRKD